MGVVVTKHQHLAERLRFFQNAIGSVPSAFDCWLAQRGAKTLRTLAPLVVFYANTSLRPPSGETW